MGKKKINSDEARYRSIFDNIQEAVALHEIILDDNGNPVDFIFLDANKTYEKITQLKASEIIGKRGFDVIPTLEQKWIDIYGKVAITGEPEIIIDHSEYLDKWWEVKAFSPGKMKFAVSMMDVTDKYKAEQELKASEEKHRLLLETSGVGIGYFNLDGKVILFNKMAAANMGGKPEDYQGKTMTELYGDNAETYLERIKDAAGSNDVKTYEDLVKLNDTEKWFLSTYNKVTNDRDEVIGVQIVSKDISEIKKVQKELKTLQKSSEYIVESIPAGLFIYQIKPDDKLILEYGNPEAKKITGVDPEKSIGKEFREIWQGPKGKSFYKEFLKVAKTGVTLKTSDSYYSDEKLDAYYRIHVFSIPENRLVVSFEDITDRKKAEEELMLHKNNLEGLVAERTKEIQEKNQELERMNNLFVGREFRIKELRDKVKELELRLKEYEA